MARTHRITGSLIASDRADQIRTEQGIGRRLQVQDHAQLGIRKVAHHNPWRHRETGNRRARLGDPLEERHRVGRLRILVEELQQFSPVEVDLILGLEQVDQGRVDLPLAEQAEVEVLTRAAPGGQCRLAQQHRRGRGCRTPGIGPGGHPPGKKQSLKAAFLEVLRRLCLDGTSTPSPNDVAVDELLSSRVVRLSTLFDDAAIGAAQD